MTNEIFIELQSKNYRGFILWKELIIPNGKKYHYQYQI